ncbi:MAG: fibronectin type III domain-containing protein, partial [Spirochaetaceae bacterium]|nr:fibronectin type III domain-containing protein [Spirochaetaceae bacterium]
MMTNPRSQNRGCLLRHITAAAALSAAALFLAACESGFDSKPNGLPIMGAAPKSVQLTGLDGALMAQWTKVSSAQGVAPTYEVYYSTNNNPASAQKFESVTAGESQLVTSKITGLTNHTTYYVCVKSVFGSLGTSDFSPVSSGKPVPPPQSMSAISVTAGEEMLELRWAPVTDAFTYNVFYSTAGGAEPPDTAGMVSVSTTGAVISGLQ